MIGTDTNALALELIAIGHQMIRIDGDRDEDNKSNLTVEQVCVVGKRLKEIGNQLSRRYPPVPPDKQTPAYA